MTAQSVWKDKGALEEAQEIEKKQKTWPIFQLASG